MNNRPATKKLKPHNHPPEKVALLNGLVLMRKGTEIASLTEEPGILARICSDATTFVRACIAAATLAEVSPLFSRLTPLEPHVSCATM